jgi:hypothetical protein
MSEAIGQPGQAALPRPLGIGEILSMAFQLYRRHWRTLLAIAAVVVVPLTLLQYLLGDLVRTQRETTSYGGVVSVTPTWLGAIAGLLAALAGILMSGVLTGAITRAVAAEVAGEDPSVEQSYRFGFHRLGSVLLVSVLVGLAIIGGLILVTAGLFLANAICAATWTCRRSVRCSSCSSSRASMSGCGWRPASRRWWWRAAGGPRPWVVPGGWSAGTGGMPLARCWSAGC